MKKRVPAVWICLLSVLIAAVMLGSAMAAEKQSVLEQIGHDGDCLAKRVLRQKVTASDGGDWYGFGWRVAISGNLALIRALGGDGNGNNSGSVYIFERDSSGVWSRQQKLTTDDVAASKTFGCSVAISGNVAIIGAYSDDDKGSFSGSAYIFERDETGVWSQKPKLIANDGAKDDFFGEEVSISGNVAIVGAPGKDSGAAYIFERDEAGAWSQKQTLVPLGVTSAGYNFGSSVSISGDVAIVGTEGLDGNNNLSGSAHIFERDGSGVWSQRQVIVSQARGLGCKVAISGNVAIAGVYGGAAYIFERDSSGVWSRKQELTELTSSVALSGNVAIVECNRPENYSLGEKLSGIVYIFERDGSGAWSQKQKITERDGVQYFPGAEFRGDVAVSNDVVVFGAQCDDDKGMDSGAAYFYDVTEQQFSIPESQKYLVFKVDKASFLNGTTTPIDAIKNKITFKMVGRNSNSTKEESYPLSLNKPFYLEGLSYVYYYVDLYELKNSFIEKCNNTFGKYEQVELRVQYDQTITSSNLADVYVTNDIDLRNEESDSIEVKSDTGTTTISWPAVAEKYQVYITDSPEPPSIDVNKLPFTETSFQTYDNQKENLSAKKVYYFWVRSKDKFGNISSWVGKPFSPKAKISAFSNTECESTATISGRKPQYNIWLKVKEVDAAGYIIKRRLYNTSDPLEEVDTKSDSQIITANYLLSGGSKLVAHGKYEYYVYTKNKLNEVSENSTPIVMNVDNLPPQECVVMRGWKEVEVKEQLSLQLGPKTDWEGDPLIYRLYIRTPGTTSERRIDLGGSPEKDYLEVEVPEPFMDKTSFEWQIRCIEANNPYGAEEYVNNDWFTTKIDTDALIIVATNNISTSTSTEKFWSTKQQPVKFTIDKNPNKSYTNYQWTFGDEKNSTANGLDNISFAYGKLTVHKPYEVQVTALDAAGVQHTGKMNISIVNTYKDQLWDDEEWSASDAPSIEGEVKVPAGKKLIIKPGTKLQMQSGSSLKVYGTLIAEDLNQGIIITKQKEDLWYGIIFDEGGTGTLSGVTISYAEKGISALGNNGNIDLSGVKLIDNQTGLYFSKGMLTATECLFEYNKNCGVQVNGSVIRPVLNSCIFNGNTKHYKDSQGFASLEEINESFPGDGKNKFVTQDY